MSCLYFLVLGNYLYFGLNPSLNGEKVINVVNTKILMSSLYKKYEKIYNKIFRSKYTALALLALIENEGKLERPRLREIVQCRDFNKYVIIPLLENGYIEVEQEKERYPYKTYVFLTDKGKRVANKIKVALENE